MTRYLPGAGPRGPRAAAHADGGPDRPARRSVLQAGAALTLLAISGPRTLADTPWPKSPITLVVPFPPGGTTDILGRIVAHGLSTKLGQTVIVDNRAGASGAIGTQFVARSAPDGYTLVMDTIGTHALNPVLRSMPYDAVKDFEPVSEVASTANVLLAYPDGPFKSVADVLAAAKAKPGEVTFGSTSAGGSPHMSGELLEYLAKVDMVHVPYKGGGPMMTDLMGGHIPLAFDNLPSAIGPIRAGKVRALAVTSAKRSEHLPDVPTIAEAGVPGYEVDAWFAVFAPAGTPASTVNAIQQAIAQTLKEPEVAKQLAEQGAVAVGSTPQELAQRQAREIKKWRAVVDASGIKLD
ncbi:Bug family tripartite tricarboxylate transporter substrate binding protein [Bordetella genomosp. 12]|uniref:LacI family transcriptional regulator n=1 Tax=Bordetella genomosp. 12 TaxID=463035 RepID=A0A261VAX3_9BORD|nr:tripartite tricarboxylate transporter substrate binding protein [Bordetella genomosp. 12]OZI70957.1 hypothetical protein CAL22_13745 [Bordetella genomosp. 12]